MGTTTGFVKNQKFEGGKYTGYIEHKLQEGEGQVKYSNGDIYDGNWKKGKREGKGTLKLSNNTMYVGIWKLGELHGPGTIFKSGGEKYEGEFINGELCGEIVHTDNKGNVYIGRFKGEKYDGYGVMIYADETIYEGKWKNGQYHGEGELKLKNGKCIKGVFKHGNLKKSYEDEKRYESVDANRTHKKIDYEVTEKNKQIRSGSKPVMSSKYNKNSLDDEYTSFDLNKHDVYRQDTADFGINKPTINRSNLNQEAENPYYTYNPKSTHTNNLKSEQSCNHGNYFKEDTSSSAYNPYQNFNQPSNNPRSPHICCDQNTLNINNLFNDKYCEYNHQNMPKIKNPECYQMYCTQGNNFRANCCNQCLHQNKNPCINDTINNPQVNRVNVNQNSLRCQTPYKESLKLKYEYKTPRPGTRQNSRGKVLNFNNICKMNQKVIMDKKESCFESQSNEKGCKNNIFIREELVD